MEVVVELLKVIGLPSICAVTCFIFRLEGKVRQNEKDLVRLQKSIEASEDKIDAMFTKISESTSLLTTASVKHDVMLDNISSNIDSLRKRFDTLLQAASPKFAEQKTE